MKRRFVRVFLIGAMVGAIVMGLADTQAGAWVPAPFYWIVVPGLLLTTPVLLALGGAHGSYAELIFNAAPIANGVMYVLLDQWIQRVRRRRQ